MQWIGTQVDPSLQLNRREDMKKLVVIFLLGISFLGLSGCNHEATEKQSPKQSSSELPKSEKSTEQSKPDKTKESTSPKETTPEKSDRAEDAKVSDDPQAPKSEDTVRTEEGRTTDLGKARIILYEAGIDSHSLTNEEILGIWKRSQGTKDFVKNVKEVLAKNEH